MAATPLTACDPVTSWYEFAYSLSWSNNCEVAQVLSDIPFISAGVLVFGVSLLILIVKRVALSAVWLFSSALLAFVGAVVDLGETLTDEVAEGTTFAASESVIRAREVLFALSIGFRFLFYWTYVAEPPRKDLSAASTQWAQIIKFRSSECTRESRSETWTRWGLPGELLRAGLLAAIVAIVALQITWRVAPRFHQYSSVYATDAALELLLSFLLLLKLLSNTITRDLPGGAFVHTFRECLAPISGLLVNIAVGVGALLSFAFTESTVGRLLQAFEVCVIVVFIMVVSFLKHRDIVLAAALSQGKKCRDAVFSLPAPVRGSTFRITPPPVETPRMSMILSAATQNMESGREVLRRSARRSLNHMSSWVSSRVSRNRSPRGDEATKLWNAEKGRVGPAYTGDVDAEMWTSIVSSTQESRGWGEIVREAAPANYLSIVSALDTQSAIAQSMAGSIHSGRVLHSFQVDTPGRMMPSQVQIIPVPVSSISPLVSSATKHTGSISGPTQGSPPYGLGGIQPQPLTNASDSRTSLDELLRQQSELDQSTEALKLFSARMSTDSHAALSPKSAELSRSSSTGQRTVSSDVSLSNFPIPPRGTIPVPSLPSTPRTSTIKSIRGDRRVRLATAWKTPVQDPYSSLSPMALASLSNIPSSPRVNSTLHSPFKEENESFSGEVEKSCRPDSSGTGYNVTSFIGGLATPNEPKQGLRESPLWPKESGHDVGTIQASSDVRKVPPHMLPIPGQSKGLLTLPATAKRLPPIPSREDIADEPVDAMENPYHDQTTRSSAIVLSPSTPVTGRAEKDMPIPPTRAQPEQPTIVSGESTDRVQGTFIRPRPPPLTIEQNLSKSQVQVLAGD